MNRNPNCNKCKHYFVTLDERHPKGCKVFNIKTKNIPSVDVKIYTGHHCPVFEEKNTPSVKVVRENSILDTFA